MPITVDQGGEEIGRLRITSINFTMGSNPKWAKSSFVKICHDFSVVVLIDSSQRKYRYGFKHLKMDIDIVTPGARPGGRLHLAERQPTKFSKLIFNGVDLSQSPTLWDSVDGQLYSGTGDEIDHWAIFETVGAILAFDTIWDLEDYWDFAFVQVSTDGGVTWTSLADNGGYSTSEYDPRLY